MAKLSRGEMEREEQNEAWRKSLNVDWSDHFARCYGCAVCES